MVKQQYCRKCSAMVYMLYGVEKCPYCGCPDLVENFGETELQKVDISFSQTKQKNRKRTFVFNDEERLALGLYPKDEGYKMSLISRILGKK